MIMLQVQDIPQGSTTIILNYGAIGALLMLCIVALVFMSRFFIRQSEKQFTLYTNEAAALRTQMNKYIEEDRKELLRVVVENTKVLMSINKTIEDFREEMHEVKIFIGTHHKK